MHEPRTIYFYLYLISFKNSVVNLQSDEIHQGFKLNRNKYPCTICLYNKNVNFLNFHKIIHFSGMYFMKSKLNKH